MATAKRRAKTAVKIPAKPKRKALVRRRRMSMIIRAIEVLIFFAALGGICYALTDYMTTSTRFKVRQIKIYGAEMLSPQTIGAEAGFTTEDNLLLVELEAARQRVEEMAYVRTCEMNRAYPDTIVIKVVEREAFATLLVNHRAFEIDDEGTVLRELDPLAPHTGPLITEVQDLGFVDLGQQLKNDALFEALAIWRAFSNTSLVEEWTLSEIAASEVGDVKMYFDNLPFELRWGGEEYERQAQELEIWWRKVQDDANCTQYLDMRFGAGIIVGK